VVLATPQAALVPNVENRITITASNTGEGPVLVGANIDLYLQRGTVPNPASDLLLNSSPIGLLTVNESSTQSLGFTVPPELGIGQVRFYAIADRETQVVELNENNNRSSTVVGFFPTSQIDIAGAFVSATIGGGGLFVEGQKNNASSSVKFTIANLSNQTIASGTNANIRAYLRPVTAGGSDGSDIAVSDIKRESLSGMKVNTSRSRDIKVKVPATVAAGDYRLIVKLDDAAAIFETNETNNLIDTGRVIRIAAPTIDLAASASTFTTITSQRTGTTAKVAFTIANLGNTAFKANATIQFFLRDADGNQIGELAPFTKKLSLNPGKTQKATGLTIAVPAQPGIYTIVVQVSTPPEIIDAAFENNMLTIGTVTVP